MKNIGVVHKAEGDFVNRLLKLEEQFSGVLVFSKKQDPEICLFSVNWDVYKKLFYGFCKIREDSRREINSIFLSAGIFSSTKNQNWAVIGDDESPLTPVLQGILFPFRVYFENKKDVICFARAVYGDERPNWLVFQYTGVLTKKDIMGE